MDRFSHAVLDFFSVVLKLREINDCFDDKDEMLETKAAIRRAPIKSTPIIPPYVCVCVYFDQ